MQQGRDGTIVSIYMDFFNLAPAEEGDYIKSNGGTVYLVRRSRQSPSRPYRYNLKALKLGKNVPIPEGERVIPLYWYRRDKKPRLR